MEVEFRQLFSDKWGVGAEQFERKLFRTCLFRHAVPFAWLLQKWNGNFFREDYELLREIATARNTDEVICELNRFFGRNARDKNFLRTMFYLRISGRRVLRAYRSVAREDQDSDGEATIPNPEKLHPA